MSTQVETTFDDYLGRFYELSVERFYGHHRCIEFNATLPGVDGRLICAVNHIHQQLSKLKVDPQSNVGEVLKQSSM